MDFNDVFGGPPKRFSLQEIGARLSCESEEEKTTSSPWREKPVFGEEVRARRRQNQNQQSDEFFNDIFKGGDRDRDPKKPTSLPLPAHLSLPVPGKVELPTFGSLPSGQVHQNYDDTRNNAFNHFHFSIYKWAGKGVPLPMLNHFKSSTFTNPHPQTQQTLLPPNNTIHAFLNQDDHQEMKDKKPKTPRVDDEMKNRKVENSSSLKLGEMNENKSVRKKNLKEFLNQEGESGDVAAKHNKSGHVSFKVVEDLKKHQPSQPSTTPNIKSSETLRTDSKENADDPLDDNFMVEEIFDAQQNVAESESSDDTEAIDAKIRQWSVGKKGNIRSLLSTLQYVLWAESGWKAVPLVDLIEANSVKRAYQKALLRLHPDKLQQNAASFHHKYTAQKVFDILQEAWDHFNTSSLST